MRSNRSFSSLVPSFDPTLSIRALSWGSVLAISANRTTAGGILFGFGPDWIGALTVLETTDVDIVGAAAAAGGVATAVGAAGVTCSVVVCAGGLETAAEIG